MKKLRGLRSLAFLALVVALASAQPAAIDIGSRRELFVDSFLIDQLKGKAELRLHHPVPQEIALTHDAPWEGTGSDYHNIFQDGDRYRMYYSARHIVVFPGKIDADVHPHFLCYAESDDGIHWRKPALGLHEFQGSKANNIVVASGPAGPMNIVTEISAVFKDANPNAAPDARYKALLGSKEPTGLLAFKSPDGIHWSPMLTSPVITDGAFDSQNLAFWDAVRGEYRAYWRYFTRGTSARLAVGVRAIYTATSRDFLHWENQAAVGYVDSPPEHLYTNQVKPYDRAPHLFIGFPARYVERQWKEGELDDARAPASAETIQHWSPSMRALPEAAARELRASSSERYGTALTEGLIMVSRDGVTFKRWNEAFLRPGIERPGTWNYGHQFIGWHVVETKSSLAGAPNELSLYAGEGYWIGKGSAVRRFTLRLDGFVSAQAPMSGGELLTKPLRFRGQSLALNFSTSAAGSVRVEIQDANGQPLPGFALDDCPPIFGDTIERSVTWAKGRDVSALAGQAVRLRFVLNDADLFAFQFKE